MTNEGRLMRYREECSMFCWFRERDLKVLRLREGGDEDKGERKGRAKSLSSWGGGGTGASVEGPA